MMNLKSLQGMALIAVLIFLEVFSLLGLYALQNNILQNRMLKNNWEKFQLRKIAREQLTKAGVQLDLQIPSCVVAVSSDLPSQPFSYWQANACVGKEGIFEYYYVVEMFGNDACAVLDGSKLTVDFYRVSLLVMSSSDGRVILQGTMVKPDGLNNKCDSVIHYVSPGWQQKVELV
jgi:hypothetical protein